MHQKALELLDKERICVLAVVLPDGSPHTAAVHYSHESEPVKLFIQTYPTVKAKAIQDAGGSAKAAVVVGLSDKDFLTLQMRGTIKIASSKEELDHIAKVHYAIHPDAEKYRNSETVFLEFTPTWWRYSDFTTDPETVINI